MTPSGETGHEAEMAAHDHSAQIEQLARTGLYGEYRECTAEQTCLAIARIARFGGRTYAGPRVTPSLALISHCERDLALLLPEVAEAVRAVGASAPSGWGWGRHPSAADRRAAHEERVRRLGELLDQHYPSLTRR
jgi:hypothetical protein